MSLHLTRTGWILVALGAGTGALARVAILSASASYGTPAWLSTLAVNLVGSLAAGIVYALLHRDDGAAKDPRAAAFLLPGLLGGFTTMSGFGLETELARAAGFFDWFAWSVSISLAAALAGAALGRRLVRS